VDVRIEGDILDNVALGEQGVYSIALGLGDLLHHLVDTVSATHLI